MGRSDEPVRDRQSVQRAVGSCLFEFDRFPQLVICTALSCCGRREAAGFQLSLRFTHQIDPMGIVDDAIENGSCQSWVFEVVVPEIDWDLGDQDAGAPLPAVVKDLKQMADLIRLQGISEPVIQDKKRCFGQAVQQLSPGPIGQGAFDFVEQSLAAKITH